MREDETEAVILNDSGNLSIYDKESGDLKFSRDLDAASRLVAIKNLAESLKYWDVQYVTTPQLDEETWIPQHGYHP